MEFVVTELWRSEARVINEPGLIFHIGVGLLMVLFSLDFFVCLFGLFYGKVVLFLFFPLIQKCFLLKTILMSILTKICTCTYCNLNHLFLGSTNCANLSV